MRFLNPWQPQMFPMPFVSLSRRQVSPNIKGPATIPFKRSLSLLSYSRSLYFRLSSIGVPDAGGQIGGAQAENLQQLRRRAGLAVFVLHAHTHHRHRRGLAYRFRHGAARPPIMLCSSAMTISPVSAAALPRFHYPAA